MPAAASVSPWRVRTIVVGPRRATTRAVSPGSASSRLPRPDPALRLADDLAGHDDDVAVAQLDQRRAAARPGRRPGRTSGTPSGASDPIAASPSGAHRRQVDGRRRHRGGGVGVGHHQGHGAAGEAGLGHAGDLAGVALVDEPAVEHAAVGAGAVVQADAGGADLDADRGRASARPCRARGCRRRWGRARPPEPGRAERLADPRDAEDRADRDDRVGRRQQHEVGVGDRVDARPGPGVGVVEPDDDDGLGRDLRRAAAPSTPGSARPGGRWASPGRRSRRASRPGRRSSAAAGRRPGGRASGGTAPRSPAESG